MITPRKTATGRSYLVRVAPFRSQTVYTREAAKRLETDMKNRKALGQLWEADPNTVGAELDDFNARQSATQTLRPRTLDFHEQSTKGWTPLRALLVSNLTRAVVEDHFVARAKVAPVAANNELKRLKACLREAMSRGQRVDPAIFAIAPVRHKARRGRALEATQLYDLGSWMPEHVRRLVPLAGQVGARQHFWFALTDEMLDLDEGTMTAPAELQKNGQDHRVCLTSIEVALFKEQLLARTNGTSLVFPTSRGRAWNSSTFRKVVWADALVAAARVDKETSGSTVSIYEGFTFHMLRHTAGSLMAYAGMDPATASERLGHTDGGALFLKTYRHLYEGERRRQAERFGEFMRAELEPEQEQTLPLFEVAHG